MALIGQRNTLPILHSAPPGFYLDGGSHGEILLPGSLIPEGVMPGETVDVFVYRDSEDRLIATPQTPHAQVGEFAYLRVVTVDSRIGIFLDWGLDKDLLLPLRERGRPLRPGDWVVVQVLLDEKTDRLFASARLKGRLGLTPQAFAEGQPVKLLIIGQTPLGYNAVVNHSHHGLLYRSELASPLTLGQKLDGFVRLIRPDGKLDLGLDPTGYRRIGPLTEQIIHALQAQAGFLPYHDGSTPEEIRAAFGTSKKAFKQAIGSLYRQQCVYLEPNGIRLATLTQKPPAVRLSENRITRR
jgi:uncharacterized protein